MARVYLKIYFNFAGNGETPRTTAYFDLFWWIHLKEAEDEVAPLTFAQRTYDKFFASEYDGGENPATHAQDGGPIPSTDAQEDGGQKPSNQFRRGQKVSSVSTGWQPKPWKLLGGTGGNTKKKTGPTSKAQESRKLFKNLKNLGQ